jgi:hypothetical protein
MEPAVQTRVHQSLFQVDVQTLLLNIPEIKFGGLSFAYDVTASDEQIVNGS